MRTRIVTHLARLALCGVLSVGCGGGSSGGGAPDATDGGAAPETPAVPIPETPSIPPSRDPRISWERRLGGGGDEYVADIASDSRGITALTWIGGAPWTTVRTPVPAALGLVRLDHVGAIVWAREFPNPHGADVRTLSMAAASGGTIVALHTTCAPSGCIDFGAGPASGSVVLRFDGSGAIAWQVPVEGTLASHVAVDARGGPIVAFRKDDGAAHIRKYDARGLPLWDANAPSIVSDLQRYALAVGANEDVLVGAGFALQALDRRGKLLWSADLAPENDRGGTSGGIESVGVAADGTVVAALSFYGAISYAGTRIEWRTPGGGSAFVVAEASGVPRLARRIPSAEYGVQDAAVDPSGRLAIAGGGGSMCGFALWSWDPPADELRCVPLACRDGSDEWFGRYSVAIDASTGDVVVAGALLRGDPPGDVDGLLESIRP